MTKLWAIEEEARRVLGRLRGDRLRPLEESLVALCEAHWPELRGARPAAPLAAAVWEVRPHLADLFVHLYGVSDPRLAWILDSLTPVQALAALVLAEIEQGDAEGVHAAYEAMMLFGSPGARSIHARSVMASFAGPGGDIDARLRHAHRPAIWRALAAVAASCGRRDAKAVLQAVRAVARVQAGGAGESGDPGLDRLLGMLAGLGVVFLGVEQDRLHYALHAGKNEHVTLRQAAEMLAEARAGAS